MKQKTKLNILKFAKNGVLPAVAAVAIFASKHCENKEMPAPKVITRTVTKWRTRLPSCEEAMKFVNGPSCKAPEPEKPKPQKKKRRTVKKVKKPVKVAQAPAPAKRFMPMTDEGFNNQYRLHNQAIRGVLSGYEDITSGKGVSMVKLFLTIEKTGAGGFMKITRMKTYVTGAAEPGHAQKVEAALRRKLAGYFNGVVVSKPDDNNYTHTLVYTPL